MQFPVPPAVQPAVRSEAEGAVGVVVGGVAGLAALGGARRLASEVGPGDRHRRGCRGSRQGDAGDARRRREVGSDGVGDTCHGDLDLVGVLDRAVVGVGLPEAEDHLGGTPGGDDQPDAVPGPSRSPTRGGSSKPRALLA